jgi:hypothetical protein
MVSVALVVWAAAGQAAEQLNHLLQPEQMVQVVVAVLTVLVELQTNLVEQEDQVYLSSVFQY